MLPESGVKQHESCLDETSKLAATLIQPNPWKMCAGWDGFGEQRGTSALGQAITSQPCIPEQE